MKRIFLAAVSAAVILFSFCFLPASAIAQSRQTAPKLTLGMADEALGPQQRMPLRAHLETAAGKPIADAMIAFSVDGQLDGQARTDANGTAVWRIRRSLEAGSYTVQATFGDKASAPAAQATFALLIEKPAMTLQVDPVQVGDTWQAHVRLARASGTPIAGGKIVLILDGKRVATGTTLDDGSLSMQVPRKLPVGAYTLAAVFDGMPGLLAGRGETTVTVAPAQLHIETVPRLAGIRFTLSDQSFVTDASGVANIDVPETGNYMLEVLPQEQPADDAQATFARWGDEHFTPKRAIRILGSTRLQVGFNMTYLTNADFVDLHGTTVDSSIVSSATVMSSDRVRYTLSGHEPRWLPGSRIVRMEEGLEARPITYVANSVVVDGSNVVNQGQQRFDASQLRRWPIQLTMYSTHFIVRDAMFGFPIGSTVQLTYPDGTIQSWPLDHNGEVQLGLLARGGYSVTVKAPGMASVLPLVLSRDQEVQLLVISYIDLAVLIVIMAAIGFGLLFAGRPQLLVLVRHPNQAIAFVRPYLRLPTFQWSQLTWPFRSEQPRSRLRWRAWLLDPTVIFSIVLVAVGTSATVASARFRQPLSAGTVAANAPAQAPTTLLVAPTLPPVPTLAPTTALIAAVPVQPTNAPPAPTAVPTTEPPTAVPAAPQTLLASTETLRLHSTGAGVVQLQQRLREVGYFNYAENTGIFGAQTLSAVKAFQSNRGLPVTGIVGPLTVEALNNCGAGCVLVAPAQ